MQQAPWRIGLKFIASYLMVMAMWSTVSVAAFNLNCLPCLSGSNELDFACLYLRPSSMQQIVGDTVDSVPDSSKHNIYSFRTSYHLGYRLALRRWMQGNRIFAGGAITWLQNSHTEAKYPLEGGIMRGYPAFAQGFVTAGKGTEKSRYLAADVEVGHQLASCRYLEAHCFAGARYIDIHAQSIGLYSPLSLEEPTTVYTHFWFRSHAIGPRLGLEFQLPVCKQWTVVARIGASFLFTVRPGNFASETINSIDLLSNISNLNSTTWAADGKMGLRLYLPSSCWGTLSIEGGCMLDTVFEGTQGAVAIPGYFIQRTLPFSVGGPYGRLAFCF